MKNLRILVGLLAAALATAASASTNGTLGPTSNGTFSVSATIASAPTGNVQVTGLSDLTLNAQGNAATNLCITHDGNGGQVGLTISSFNAADTDFRISTPGGSNSIQMNFTFVSNVVPSTGSYPLTEGTELVLGANTTCTPADMGLEISSVDIAAAPAGNYSNTFLVTLTAK